MATPAEIEADLKKILWQNNPSSAASDGSSSRGQDGGPSHRLQRPSSKQRRRGDRPPPDGRPERGRRGHLLTLLARLMPSGAVKVLLVIHSRQTKMPRNASGSLTPQNPQTIRMCNKTKAKHP